MNWYSFIDIGFGDSGKGRVISEFCSSLKHRAAVVRFNGGAQAGHTVKTNNIEHVFSHYGSGTLSRIPTYWSEFCPVNPMSLLEEFKVLTQKGIVPKLVIHPLAPVTLPVDVFANVSKENMRHGTCGVGVGPTLKRQEETPWNITIGDARYSSIFQEKVRLYYQEHDLSTFMLPVYFEVVAQILNLITISDYSYFHYIDDVVFEGAQGFLLDRDRGFFPHVTRSKTDYTNIYKIMQHFGASPEILRRNLITRSYSTRHGNGPIIVGNNQIDQSIINPHETNVYNEYQGQFKTASLSSRLVGYALDWLGASNEFSYNSGPSTLHISCLDVTDGSIYLDKGKVSVEKFCEQFDVKAYKTYNSPITEGI